MTDTPPLDPIVVSDLRAELAKSQAEAAALRAMAQEYRVQVLDPPTPIIINNTSPVTHIDTEYELLSGEIRRGLSDGVKVGGATLVVLGIVAAVLPSMNLPAADLTTITAVTAGVSAFLSWAARHGITAQSK